MTACTQNENFITGNRPVIGIMVSLSLQLRNEADDQEVKNIVNELLKTRSLATLAAAECPLSNVCIIFNNFRLILVV